MATKVVQYPYATLTQTGSTQPRPYVHPLPYEMSYLYGRRRDVLDRTGNPQIIEDVKSLDFDLWTDPLCSPHWTPLRNQAYERLRGQLGSTAGWAENIAQIGKTRTAIVQRAVQIASVASSVRRGRFGDAARALRTPIPSGVSNRKAAAQNFLEFEYGWKPLFKDLVDSADALTSFPEVRRVLRGRSHMTVSSVERQRASGSTFNNYNYTTIIGDIGCSMQTVAVINNPNLFLANQLGIIDFALPWKLIPFSFIVDWFVNVEQVISSVSDWYGVTLQDAQMTWWSKGIKEHRIRNYSWNYTTLPYWDESFTRDYERESVHMQRILGLPGPSLAVKPFKGFSLERGAQAISLVLSVLGR
jgi:hypothetical protein